MHNQMKHVVSSFTSMRASSTMLRGTMGEKNTILLFSCLVGCISGLAAVLLRSLCERVHLISAWLVPDSPASVYLQPLMPAIGIFFCILFVKLFIRKTYEKGLSGVIMSAASGTSNIPVSKTFTHIITSGVAVGFGVSAGLEAPTALTGSAIGSNIARLFHLGRERRTLLLACGGAAGIAAVFGSPVAGTLFACEILLPEFSVSALIPLLMSSAIGALVSSTIFPGRIFTIAVTGWQMSNIPYYLMLGVLAGCVSAFVIKMSCTVSKSLAPMKNVWLKGLFGAALLYVAFLLMPALRGEGYIFIHQILSGSETRILEGSPIDFLFNQKILFLGLVALLVVLKAIVSPLSTESGGDGGIFAPSMFIGAFTGFFLARFIRVVQWPAWGAISENDFIAVGMGGVLAGVMHAPMTGIFLIAEITGGYQLFVPLMIATSISSYVCEKFFRYNIYKSMIVMNGGSAEMNQDTIALDSIHVSDIIETDFSAVREADTLQSLLDTFMQSKRSIFPVLTDDGCLAGVITLDSIRHYILNEDLYQVVLAYDVMSQPETILDYHDTVGSAARLFESQRVWCVPVVRKGKYCGFVTKAGVFDKYRDILRKKQELF